MKRILSLTIILSFTIKAQFIEAPALKDANEVFNTILAAEGSVTYLNDNEQVVDQNNDCNEHVNLDDEFLDEDFKEKADVFFEFSVNKITGIDTGNSERVKIDAFQSEFNEAYQNIISQTDSASREQTMQNICSNWDKDKAIGFAGFLGAKNSAIYDYQRVSNGNTGTQERLNEVITLDDYYQTHRNVFGDGDGDREKMGVCGDSATMVANFLKNCHFSCDEIDIVSYRTATGGGHQMVTARGENGQFYSANWSSAESLKNANPLTYNTPEPNNINASPSMELFDCNGKPKGQTLTPLGHILMMAHGNQSVFNNGVSYDEIKTALGVNNLNIPLLGESLLKLEAGLFQGKDAGVQSAQGGFGRIHLDNHASDKMLMVEIDGSIVVAKASREFNLSENQINQLDQTIVSPSVRLELMLNALETDNVVISPYINGQVTYFKIHNDYTKQFGENDPTTETSTNQDITNEINTGLRVSGFDGPFGLSYNVDASLQTQVLRNENQKSKDRGYVLKPTAVVVSGVVSKEFNNSSLDLNIDYRDQFLIQRSQTRYGIQYNRGPASVEGSYTIYRNPDIGTMKGFGINTDVQISNGINIGAGAQYLIIEEPQNNFILNVGLAFKL